MDVGLDVDLAIVAASGRTTWNSVSLTAGLKFFLRSARVSIRRVPGRLKAALYDKHTSALADHKGPRRIPSEHVE